MKKILLFCLFGFIPLLLMGQKYKLYPTKNYHNSLQLNTVTGQVKQIQDDGLSWNICNGFELDDGKENRFRLFQTQNMWTFILLDTFAGKTWQVQFSVKGEEYMFAAPINQYSLAYPWDNSIWIDRFQLFETQNMWTFILLDSYNGRLWQVQYSSENLNNVFCIPINETELVSSGQRNIFTIEPMTSMYQYYLVNGETGEMWQFQWTTKGPDYRWIKKIH